MLISLEYIFVTEISGCQIKYCVLEDEVSISGSLGRGLISTGSETASEPRLEVSLNGGAGGFSSSSDDIFFLFWILNFSSDIFLNIYFIFRCVFLKITVRPGLRLSTVLEASCRFIRSFST